MKITRQDFEKLALEHIDMVFRVARTMTRSLVEAEDLVQETYLRAIGAWETFDLRSHGIRPWLLRILHNLHLNRVGKDARRPASLETEHLQEIPAAPQEFVEPWQANEKLNAALNRYPPELRTTMLLWAIEELSYQEMAEAQDVPIGTIMSRLHRARHRLRESMRDMAPSKPGKIADTYNQ